MAFYFIIFLIVTISSILMVLLILTIDDLIPITTKDSRDFSKFKIHIKNNGKIIRAFVGNKQLCESRLGEIMGKTALCVQLLEILNTKRIYKINELANALNTNPRNIPEYKKELEECGYYIETIPGKYGGYRLNSNNILPTFKLSGEEKEALLDSFNYSMQKNDFLRKNELSLAMGKLSSSIELPEEDDKLLIVDKYHLTMNNEEIKKRYDFLDNAIKVKRAIKIEYESIKNGLKIHILHPYKLFINNNSWFFLAYNPEVGEIWYFKLNRIVNFKLLNEKFTIWKGFKAKDFFDENGLLKNGEFIRVVFVARGIRKNLIKERIYGKNQNVEAMDGNSIKVSVDMQSKDQIISFVLSNGTDIELLEPKTLVDEVKNKIKEMAMQYEVIENENKK